MPQHIISQIHSLLIKKRKSVAVAESCTGGLLAKLLTDIPGSSRYFILGVVAYNNKVKGGILKVPSRLISREGAVSAAACQKMAQSVKKLAKADFGIGITGIAGPGGGTAAKPVGTVFIAIDSQRKKICQKFHFRGRRASARKKSALKALELLKGII